MSRKFWQHSFRFLDLPPEIRCEIYVHFLATPLTTTHRAPILKIQAKGPNSFLERYLNTAERCNLFPSSPPHFSAIPLLLCNRLINTEFNAVISTFVKSHKLRYELDCLVKGEEWLYPDWTVLPVKASHIPCLYAVFRFTGMASNSMLQYDGGPTQPAMICSLLYILYRFLQRGPYLRSQVKNRNITVGTLVLDVLTRDLKYEPRVVFKPIGVVGRDNSSTENIKSTMIHPETFVQIIARYLNDVHLHRFTLPEVLTISSSVDKVYLLHDGHEKGFWDFRCTPDGSSSSGSSSNDEDGDDGEDD